MTNAITNFYMFIAREYQGQYDRVKTDIDYNGDGIITHSEFDSFIKSTPELSNFSMGEITSIFGNLDTITSGKIKDTTVSERGALNQTEQANLDSNIQRYGIVYTLLNDNFGCVSGYVSQYASTYNLSQDNVVQQAFELILGTYSINNAQNLTAQDAQTFLKKAVAELIKNSIIESNATVLNQLSSDYPGFENDPDLNRLLSDYFSTIDYNTALYVANGQSVHNIIQGIIEKYFETAGLNTVNYHAGTNYPDGMNYNGEYQYNPSAKLNTIQLSRLTHEYESALGDTNTALSTDGYLHDYEGILNGNVAYLKNLISQFIDSKKSVWEREQSSNFSTLFNGLSESGIQNEFKSSDIFKHIEYAEDLLDFNNEFTEDMTASTNNGSNIHVHGGSNNLPYTYGDDNFLQGLLNIVGFSSFESDENGYSTFKSFLVGKYDKYIRAAFCDIIANPEKYEIDLNDCTKEEMQDAILEYISKHTVDVAQDMGLSRTKTTTSVVFGALQACKAAVRGGRHITLNDAQEAVESAVLYVMNTYTARQDIMRKLTELGLTSTSAIANMDASQLETVMQQLYWFLSSLDNLESTTEVTGTTNTGGTNGGGQINGGDDPNNQNQVNFHVLTQDEISALKTLVSSYSLMTKEAIISGVEDILKAKVLGDNGIGIHLFDAIFNYAKNEWSFNLLLASSTNAQNLIDIFVTKYNELNNSFDGAGEDDKDFINFYKSIYGEGYNIKDGEGNFLIEWGTYEDGDGDSNTHYTNNQLGIPSSFITSGAITYSEIDSNSVYGKISSIGNALYNTARYQVGRAQAYAAYQTFMSYYAWALLALNGAMNFDNGSNQSIDPAQLRGNDFYYDIYKADGTKSSGHTEEQTSLVWTSGHSYFDDYSDFKKPNAQTTETGLYVGVDRDGTGQHTSYIYMDTEILARKFLEFLAMAA